ncbi:MAG: hypothetical protein ABSD47_20865 [Candidatus Methylomirabilota bacterium]|jgi:hypothetical protein
MVAEQATPKTTLLELMKRRPVLLGISAAILIAALVGVGVVIGQLSAPKSSWVLWAHALSIGYGTSSERWDVTAAYDSRRKCEADGKEYEKIRLREESEKAKGYFNPTTGKTEKFEEAIHVDILYVCLPQGVDPRRH